jgi:hypothetical protein
MVRFKPERRTRVWRRTPRAAARSRRVVFSWKETQGAARVLGVTLQSHEVQGPNDFAAAFAAIAEERPHALLILRDALATQQRKEIIDFAIQKRLPSMFMRKPGRWRVV